MSIRFSLKFTRKYLPIRGPAARRLSFCSFLNVNSLTRTKGHNETPGLTTLYQLHDEPLFTTNIEAITGNFLWLHLFLEISRHMYGLMQPLTSVHGQLPPQRRITRLLRILNGALCHIDPYGPLRCSIAYLLRGAYALSKS